MKLYDPYIKQWEAIEKDAMAKGLGEVSRLTIGAPYDTWPDKGEYNMILRHDMAYELGGLGKEAVSLIAFTKDQEMVGKDEVILYGPDLSVIKGDCSFARIALVRLKNNFGKELTSDEWYRQFNQIEYARYHINPKGYMMRVSVSNEKEAVRVSEEAIQEGISFAHVGNAFLKEYHKHPLVESVKLYFITQGDFPFTSLKELARTTNGITQSLDHIFKNLKMDCNTCNLKEICDEVEGLKELHFSKEKQSEK